MDNDCKKFHVMCEQTHILSSFIFQYSHQQVDIVLLVDNICTLVDVVIVDFNPLDIVLCVALF